MAMVCTRAREAILAGMLIILNMPGHVLDSLDKWSVSGLVGLVHIWCSGSRQADPFGVAFDFRGHGDLGNQL